MPRLRVLLYWIHTGPHDLHDANRVPKNPVLFFDSWSPHFIFCISLEKKRVRGLRVVQGARGPAEKKTRRTRIRGGGEDFSKYVDRTPDYEKV